MTILLNLILIWENFSSINYLFCIFFYFKEYEIKKPILFNTDSSKSKLWVDYNPKIRKIDGKELSLLNRVYSALKPVENRLDDSLRLSPSLDRVMMKYGYWEWIEDREILKALKDFNVEIEDDYDDDCGYKFMYTLHDSLFYKK